LISLQVMKAGFLKLFNIYLTPILRSVYT
jgi:hypothetical protein